MRDATVRRLSGLHAFLFRVTGGRIGGRLVNNDMLLLTTWGRATGRTHTVPLLYLRTGRGLLVVASYGGRHHHPEWYRNLVANPSVRVRLPGGRFAAVARTMTGDERREWWPRVVAAYDGYASYESRTDREIPLVELTILGG